MSRNKSIFIYSFITIFILSNILWNQIFQHQQQTLLIWGGAAFQTIACLLATIWLITASLQQKGEARIYWILISIGINCYFIAVLTWGTYSFLFNNQKQWILLSDLFALGQNISYLLALGFMMRKIKNNFLKIRFLLDIFIVMSVVLAFNWIFILSPLLHKEVGVQTSDFIFPILDLGVLIGVLSIAFTTNYIFNRSTSWFLIAGFSIQIIADAIYSYYQVLGTYHLGSLNEPLWILSILILGLAGKVYHVQPSATQSAIRRKPRTRIIRHSLPYLTVVVLLVFGILSLHHIQPISITIFITLLLVVFRQLFTLMENEQLLSDLGELNGALEARVEERTIQLKESIDKMEYLAYHDVVTNIPNRRYMEKQLIQAIENNKEHRKIAFILLDLDRFKHINDSLGHTNGDHLLKELGKRLEENLTRNQTACRIGGDEFALLLEDTTDIEIEKKALQTLAILREPFKLNGMEIHMTPSIGISLFPDHAYEFERLLMKADIAMYKVKETGKNNFKIYQSCMSMDPYFQLESSIRKGIERKEFEVYYQPQVKVDTNKVEGLEALIRWNRPGHGYISPLQFIPLAEETGLILQLGKIVLTEVCKQIVAWEQKEIRNIRVAVNISPVQFQQVDFVETVSNILINTGVNPECLELEITESLAMGPIETNLEKLNCLKQMGLQIALDDFGTGYSSLHYLSQFPIDRLKIDRSFIYSIQKSDKDNAIVQLIVMMAGALNFKVLAEGVETEEQKQFLTNIFCDEYQGFLYSPPLPADVCERLLLRETRSVNVS